MKTAEIFKISDNPKELSNAFIRIKDKRTPCGNYFFRLDKLNCISINDNAGLTPLLEVTGGYISPDVPYEQFMNFMMQVFSDISENDNSIKIYELIVDEETMRDIPPRTRKTLPDKNNKTTHSQKLYSNGAHTGYVCYTIDAWGMNSPAREAVIKQHLDDYISNLNINWKGLQVPKL